jgi:hypothetical protein
MHNNFVQKTIIFHLKLKEILIMRKYLVLLGMVALMTTNMYAQLLYPPIVQGKLDPLDPNGDIFSDDVLYCHLTINNRKLSDTVNCGIHLAPVDTIRALGEYSAQLRFRSIIQYNGIIDARDTGNKSGYAVSNYAAKDTIRLDTTVMSEGFHCWLSIHFFQDGSDSISRYDAFIQKDGSAKLDTIVVDAGFRNNPRPVPYLRIWSLIPFEFKNTNLVLTNEQLGATVGVIPTSVKDINLSPAKFNLSQSFPNPFNPETRIQFSLLEKGKVQLNVYNMLGQVVAVLVNGELSAGTKEVVWNGTDQNGRSVTSGVYFYRLETPQGAITKKMTLVK